MESSNILNDLAEHIQLRMKSCNRYSHAPSWIERKVHRDYDMWFVERGVIHIDSGGIAHTATAGDVVFFYPDMPYTATTGEEGCQFIFVHFDIGIGNQQRILDDFELAGIVRQGLIQQELACFRKTFESYQKGADVPGIRLYLKGCLTLVIAKIIELHSGRNYLGTFAGTPTLRRPATSLILLQPVVQFIHIHSHRPIKIGELAVIADMSEKYFITYFKRALGITPNQYIIQVKMNKARDYLYRNTFAIQEIAGLLGYSDPFTFSKAFKKYYGVSPSQFI